MKQRIPGSEHAFPHLHFEDGAIHLKGGLSKRELFAAMAMQGLLSNTHILSLPMPSDEFLQLPKLALKMADLFIEELEKDDGE